MKLSSNVVGVSNNENIFLHKLLLTNVQVSRLCKTFENNSTANIKLSKTLIHEKFLSTFLGPLLKTSLPLMKNILLAKSTCN